MILVKHTPWGGGDVKMVMRQRVAWRGMMQRTGTAKIPTLHMRTSQTRNCLPCRCCQSYAPLFLAGASLTLWVSAVSLLAEACASPIKEPHSCVILCICLTLLTDGTRTHQAGDKITLRPRKQEPKNNRGPVGNMGKLFPPHLPAHHQSVGNLASFQSQQIPGVE